jgi:hypothetical protein
VRLLRNRDVVRLMFGILLLALVLGGQALVGWLSSGGKVDQSLREATGPVAVTVTMVEGTDAFHLNQLRRAGTFAGRPSPQEVNLLNVAPENLDWLARQVWVIEIRPAQ